MRLRKFYNLKSCILFFVVFAALSWILLEIYFLSVIKRNEKSEKFNPILFKVKLYSAIPGKPDIFESAFEKLKRIHQEKLKIAGMKSHNEFRNRTSNSHLKDSSVLKKLKLIHQQKMNKAGFGIDAQDNIMKSHIVTKIQLEYPETLEINYNVHIFYYPWYGNPENDGQYLHWNHHYVPHWKKMESIKWPQGQHRPPEDIAANYYPLLGLYSSGDPQVVEAHMAQIRSTAVGVYFLYLCISVQHDCV